MVRAYCPNLSFHPMCPGSPDSFIGFLVNKDLVQSVTGLGVGESGMGRRSWPLPLLWVPAQCPESMTVWAGLHLAKLIFAFL